MAHFHAKWEIIFPSYSKLLSYYRLPRKVRITCRNGLNMEEVCHLGFTFTDVRLQFKPVTTAKWVNIRRLIYGIPNKGIADALKPYGKVIQIKMDSFMEFMLVSGLNGTV
jgi:hypothetical protein